MGECGDTIVKEGADVTSDIVVVERPAKTLEPGFDLGRTDRKGLVSHSHPWMSALRAVELWPTCPLHEICKQLVPRNRIVLGEESAHIRSVDVHDVIETIDDRTDLLLSADRVERRLERTPRVRSVCHARQRKRSAVHSCQFTVSEAEDCELNATLSPVAGMQHVGSGKVREIFRVDDERLFIAASNRISAFDVVLDQDIPAKGQVLTGVSKHWFDILETPNHLISIDTSAMEFLTPEQQRQYAGRSMLVHAAQVIPMECVVRGYLYGSSWKEYAAGGGPTTEHLPDGLDMASKLPEPIFTPATKAETGHDENLTEADARSFVGNELYEELRRRSMDIYLRGADYAAERGIILADTKFEFGTVGDEIILIDEVLTPDSSRYWPQEAWAPGAVMPSFDKQPVRDWLEGQGGWNKKPPAPALPADVIDATSNRYIEAYELLTGRAFADYLEESGAS